MPAQPIPEDLELQEVAQRCSAETERFFERRDHDPRYCFELFRRAIRERLERAWHMVYLQYRPLVLGWIARHPAFPSCEEESSYFANRAFERMWAALSPERFDRFPNLKSLLRYLQMCVHSVLVDHARSMEQQTLELEARLHADPSGSAASARHLALERMARRQFWQEIDARLLSDKERCVVQDSFVYGLKPREVYERNRSIFSSVTEVYRIKENVLARLRRDAELAKLVG